MNLPTGALALLLSFLAMRRMQTTGRQLALDVLGSLLITASVICLVLFVTWSAVLSLLNGNHAHSLNGVL